MSLEDSEADGLATYLRTATGGIAGNADLRTLLGVYLLLLLVTELYQKALPLYVRELSVPVAVLGIGLSAGNAVEVVASPVVGAAADRFDRFGLGAAAGGVVAVALFALAAVGSAASGSIPGLGALPAAWTAPALVALLAVFAGGRISLNTAITPAVSDALDDEFAGMGWGVRDVTIYLGSALGLAIGGVVLSVLTAVRYAFLALVPVVLALVVLLWRRRDSAGGSAVGSGDGGTGDEGGDAGRPGDGADDPPTIHEAVRSLLSPSIPDVPRPSRMARFAAVSGLSNAAFGMSVFLLPLYAGEVGLRGDQFLFLFSGTFLVSAPLSLFGGIAADRFDRKRLYVGNFLVETLMLAAFALVGGFSIAGSAVVPSGGFPLFLVGTALYVLQTTFEPAVAVFFFDSFDEDESGRAWGISGMVSKGVGIVAPTAGSLVYAVDPGAVFLIAAVLMAGATLVAVTIPRS